MNVNVVAGMMKRCEEKIMPKMKVKKGDRYGRLSILKEMERNKHGARVFKCECDCGNIRDVSFWHLRNGHTKSCGCLNRENLIKKATTHGLAKHPLYKTYRNILQRCYNPNNYKYTNYGGRGIKVCDRWLNKETGLKNFIKDVGKKPSKKHTIDRIDNDGDYCPENVSWKTYSDQNLNQRMKKNNSSGFTGVSPLNDKWRSYITYNGVRYELGRYTTINEAVEVRNNFIIKNKLKHKIQEI